MEVHTINKEPIAQVLDNAELLEMILLSLPTRDLLLAQCISPTYKATIDRSTALQRRLFLTPTCTQIIVTKQENPIFTTTDLSKLQPTSGPVCGQHSIAFNGSVFEINPFLSYIWPAPAIRRGSEAETTPDLWNTIQIVSQLQLRLGARRHQSVRVRIPTRGTVKKPPLGNAEALAYKDASWRKMLLTQPPLWKPTCSAHHCRPYGSVEAKEGKGITLESVAEWEAEKGSDQENVCAHLTLLVGEVRAVVPVP